MALADVPLDLVESCRRRDREAVDALLRLISPDIYRIVYSLLRDHDDTDEVVQETLIRVFRYLETLKEPERFAAWVMRIAINQVQTWRMRRNRTRFYELDDMVEPEEGVVVLSGTSPVNPRDEAARREMRQQIEQAMGTLPDRQQTAVTLFELEGLSIREIAQVMRCSEGAVKFNIHEARKKLQHRLGHMVAAWFGRRAEAPARPAESRRRATGSTKP